MKTRLEKVYSKLPKRKVDLSVSSDLDLLSKSVITWSNNIDISVSQLEEAKNSLEVDGEDLKADMDRLYNQLVSAENSAEELGIDANNIPNYSDAYDVYNEGLNQLDKVENINK